MRVAQINTVSGYGSTGKICEGISEILNRNGVENIILYASGHSDYNKAKKYSCNFYAKLQALKARLFGNWGFNSFFITKKLVRELKVFKPDIVHLHNLHGHNCNLTVLFKYLKKSKQKIVWTFHDCWAFTAYCTHFTLANCNKWVKHCCNCPQYKNYSWFFDNSASLYKKKEKLFSNLDLTIVTPSKWLAELVQQSFLKNYSIQVINNGIDLNIFKPTKNSFREKYNIGDKFIVLGVAFGWGERKGLDIFIELSKRLDDKKYQIVLVGTDDKVDKLLPKSVISIHRTQNQEELAEIYTAATVFANPTREEVLGLVNIEANACGTPVVTFNTGGSPECVNTNSGVVVDQNIESMESEIIRICEASLFTVQGCRENAVNFDMYNKYNKYFDLYRECIDCNVKLY